MGFFQGEAQGLFLGEEFHHNRINLVCSQISGVNPQSNIAGISCVSGKRLFAQAKGCSIYDN
jgi:hypothetical protein